MTHAPNTPPKAPGRFSAGEHVIVVDGELFVARLGLRIGHVGPKQPAVTKPENEVNAPPLST